MTFKPINLQDIIVQNIPEEPCYQNRNRKDYKILAHYNTELVGHVTIAMFSLDEQKKDDFWFEKKNGIWTPRVVVFVQEIEPNYRGQGVNGELLKRINEMTKTRFTQPLASSISFVTNPIPNWYEMGFKEKPGMRVWEKLETEGFAYSLPYNKQPRWIMY